jgi:hypothetical protein
LEGVEEESEIGQESRTGGKEVLQNTGLGPGPVPVQRHKRQTIVKWKTKGQCITSFETCPNLKKELHNQLSMPAIGSF